VSYHPALAMRYSHGGDGQLAPGRVGNHSAPCDRAVASRQRRWRHLPPRCSVELTGQRRHQVCNNIKYSLLIACDAKCPCLHLPQRMHKCILHMYTTRLSCMKLSTTYKQATMARPLGYSACRWRQVMRRHPISLTLLCQRPGSDSIDEETILHESVRRLRQVHWL
jgi:hypothetical protein